MDKRLFLVDGSAFAYRSFYAIRGLTDSNGRPTNAVYGFARVLLKLLREREPSHVAIAFDAPGKTFRADLYPEYKATRKETPAELVTQLPLIDRLVAALRIPVFRVPGVEADDVLGTLARRGEQADMDVVIVTSDKDALQLVTDRVSVFDPSKGDNGIWYDRVEVQKRYGVTPQRIVDLFGLMGDASDNVPGVRGIGEKTARRLLETYETLDELYAHLEDLRGKQRERLADDRETAFLSRELVTIHTDVDLDATVADCARQTYDCDALIDLFTELDFQSLVEQFLPDASAEEKTDYRLVTTRAMLEQVAREMRSAGRFALDTETTSTSPMRADLVGISMSCRAGTGYYIPIGHTPEALRQRAAEDELFPTEVCSQLPRETALEVLRPLLEDAAIGKTGHNIKYDLIVLERAGVHLAGIALDTMVASYLTDPARLRHNLMDVSLQYLKRKTTPISELIGKGSKTITFDNVPVERACLYACEDADMTWRLTEVLGELLQKHELQPLFEEVELPLIGVLAQMEMAGIAIDLAVFEGLQHEIEQRLKTLEANIFELAGRSFQVSSPKQLQEVLFTELGLSPGRRTKTGFSTDVEVLEQLSKEHPLPEKILEFRMLDKLRGTYVEALPKLVHPETGRIHTSFNQAVAATGRLSSSAPNLQNIPVRSEIGRRIRAGFVPGNASNRLISADYSQIELRILAHLSGDEQLKQAFRAGADIHSRTASRVFGVAEDAVTADMRRQAKAVNFGVVYGISPFGLAKNLGVSNDEAARFIEQYFLQYPGVRAWIDGAVESARRTGYATTLLNRRRYIAGLDSSDNVTRKAAERVAVNTPVQGTAADVIKLAMVRLHEALSGTRAQLLLQVHDELVLEAPTDDAPRIAQTTKQMMEHAIALDVPLQVDVGIGQSWAEIH